MLFDILTYYIVKEKLEMRKPILMFLKRLLNILFPSPSVQDIEEAKARFKRAFIN